MEFDELIAYGEVPVGPSPFFYRFLWPLHSHPGASEVSGFDEISNKKLIHHSAFHNIFQLVSHIKICLRSCLRNFILSFFVSHRCLVFATKNETYGTLTLYLHEKHNFPLISTGETIKKNLPKTSINYKIEPFLLYSYILIISFKANGSRRGQRVLA